jgi:hypothetical protein
MDHHLPQSCFGGQNVAVEYRWAGDRVAWSTPTAQAAKQATKSIPIIAAVMADPVGDGLVASLARPGGNVTGTTFLGPELVARRLQLVGKDGL